MSQVLKEILFSISAGDFIDRYSIAKIKKDCGVIPDTRNFEDLFKVVFDPYTYAGNLANESFGRLITVNEMIWCLNDQIREKLCDGLDSEVADLAQEIVSFQDKRAKIKRNLDQKLGYTAGKKKYSGEEGYEI